ncbi:MAG: 4-hydroxythreonine-4-phosphate dehydrogenase PdxA, partial [Pseudobdellovibrio sp.]
VHITMGLPFVRTSVDHGTAYDIFNKNKANPQSMLEALKLNLHLLGVKNV